MDYTIQQGDTLGSLAKKYGTTTQNLQALNTSITDPNKIYTGGVLKVPTSTATTGVTNTSPIDASKLGTTTTPTLPPAINDTTANNNLATTVGTFTQGIIGSQAQAQAEADRQAKTTPTAPVNERQGIIDKITSILGIQGTQGQVTQDIYNQEGVFEKKKETTRLENEALAKSRAYELQARKIQENTQGKFGGAVEQDLQNLDRMKNQELADIAIQYKVSQGAYADANSIAEAKVKMQFEPLENELKTLNNLYALYQNDLSESEKMQAQTKIQEKRDSIEFERQKELAALKNKYDIAGDYRKAAIDAKSKAQELLSTGSLDPKVIATNQFKTIEAYAPAVRAIKAYQENIKKYGSGEKINAVGSGAIKSSYGDAIAAWKTLAALGALSGADFGLAENVIPEPRILARDKKVLTQLSGALDRGSAQVSFLGNSLKRAYPTSSTGIDLTIQDIGSDNVVNSKNDPLGLGINVEVSTDNPLGI